MNIFVYTTYNTYSEGALLNVDLIFVKVTTSSFSLTVVSAERICECICELKGLD